MLISIFRVVLHYPCYSSLSVLFLCLYNCVLNETLLLQLCTHRYSYYISSPLGILPYIPLQNCDPQWAQGTLSSTAEAQENLFGKRLSFGQFVLWRADLPAVWCSFPLRHPSGRCTYKWSFDNALPHLLVIATTCNHSSAGPLRQSHPIVQQKRWWLSTHKICYIVWQNFDNLQSISLTHWHTAVACTRWLVMMNQLALHFGENPRKNNSHIADFTHYPSSLP